MPVKSTASKLIEQLDLLLTLSPGSQEQVKCQAQINMLVMQAGLKTGLSHAELRREAKLLLDGDDNDGGGAPPPLSKLKI